MTARPVTAFEISLTSSSTEPPMLLEPISRSERLAKYAELLSAAYEERASLPRKIPIFRRPS